MSQTILNEKFEINDEAKTLTEKYASVLDATRVGMAKVEDHTKRKVTARLLETQQEMINESINGVGGMDTWQPVLISMVRRIAPRLIAYDVCGVQPMTGPTGLIFALKARYGKSSTLQQNDQSLPEAMGIDEVEAGYSGDGTANAGNSFGSGVDAIKRGGGMTTQTGEIAPWQPMGVTIEKTSVEAKTRQLRADYSHELAQDMRKVHGLDADAELINILSNEIVSEINREVIGTIYNSAKVGAQFATKAGTFDLSTDSDGRWSVEKFKGLLFAIERDANKISLETRRGKGNILFVSADIGSALAAAGVLDFAPALQAQVDVSVDASGATYAGNLGRFRVYVDPYATGDGYCVGYKGADQYDAGLFYAPYIPLELCRAVNPVNFQNAIGFKTRYGLVANPFTTLQADSNIYYRKAIVSNLMA